ncbi:MAG: archaeosortase/exosortase family protein [Candidatus Norongarragalinales archaeon]
MDVRKTKRPFFSLSEKEKHFLFYFTTVFSLIFALLKLAEPRPVNLLVAQLQESLLSSAGYGVLRDGASLVVENAAFEIVVDCSGLVMMALFFALLYATKTRIPHLRMLGYFAFFFTFNLLRVAFTIAVGAEYGPQAIDVVHPALWFVDSGLVFGCWAKEYGLFKRL